MSKFTQLVSQFTRRGTKRDRNQDALTRNNLVVVLAVVIMLLGAMYFVQINRSTTKSFALQALVQQQAQLLQQKSTLELQQAQMTALSNLQDSPVVSQLVASTHVEYLNTSTADVARR